MTHHDRRHPTPRGVTRAVFAHQEPCRNRFAPHLRRPIQTMGDSSPSDAETTVFSVNAYEILALAVVIGLVVAEYVGVVSFESAVMAILVLLTVSHLVRPYSS